MSNRKLNKRKTSKRTVALGLVLLMLLTGGVGIFSTYGVNVMTLKKSTAEKIIDRTNKELKNYSYCCLVFDVETDMFDESGEETYTQAQYIISSGKDTSETSYIYRDADSTLNQYWYYDEEQEKYKVYIYSTEYNKWVSNYLDYEPISTDSWNLLTNINTYTYKDETAQWSDGTECYVFDKEYSTDTWQYILERIYIDKETYLVKGIALYGTNGSGRMNTDDLSNYQYSLENEDGSGMSLEYELYDATVQRYDLSWSKEPINIFILPNEETTITDDDYMHLQYGSEWDSYLEDPEKYAEEHPIEESEVSE